MVQMYEGGNTGPDSYLAAVQDPLSFDDIAQAGRRKLQQGRIWGSAGPRSWHDSGIGRVWQGRKLLQGGRGRGGGGGRRSWASSFGPRPWQQSNGRIWQNFGY
jgi:hypothetical protein